MEISIHNDNDYGLDDFISSDNCLQNQDYTSSIEVILRDLNAINGFEERINVVT